MLRPWTALVTRLSFFRGRRLLTADDPRRRRRGIRLLARAPREKALPLLLEALREDEPFNQAAAAEALAASRATEAIEPLLEILERAEGNPHLIAVCWEAVSRISGREADYDVNESTGARRARIAAWRVGER